MDLVGFLEQHKGIFYVKVLRDDTVFLTNRHDKKDTFIKLGVDGSLREILYLP